MLVSLQVTRPVYLPRMTGMDTHTVSFRDGPVAGREFKLPRTTIMLRVAVDRRGAGRCLGGLLDEPARGETTYAYIMVKHQALFDRGRLITDSTYRLLPNQPSQDDMQSRAAWMGWCEARKDKITAIRDRLLACAWG